MTNFDDRDMDDPIVRQDVDRLADLIAEGRRDDALALVHELWPHTLKPRTTVMLVEQRRAGR